MKKLIITILILTIMLPFCVKATSTIAYEMDTKQILFENNIHEKRAVASISKIMTAILACESGKLDDVVTIGDEIKLAYGSGIYIQEGEQMKLRDLVFGLMLRSGNDASYAIAKYVGGSIDNFIKLMNKKANELDMKDTIYHNPNGLDDNGGNISTAYDMALLTSYAMHNEEYKKITGTKKYTLKTNKNFYVWPNKNKLLHSYRYTTGGKTGYTDVAKRTLVTTASNNNLNIVVVTLNDGNDFNDHKVLYERLFDEYKGYNLLQEGNINILNEKYYKGNYVLKNNFKYALKENEKDSVILKFVLIKKISQEDDNIGYVKLYLGDKYLGQEQVYIKYDKKVTLWQKIKKILHKDSK